MENPTTLTFAFRLPSGGPVAGGTVAFTLSGYDLDSGIVMPVVVEAQIGEDGTGSVQLWPNDAGLTATSYKAKIVTRAGAKLELSGISVPESVTPVPLHTLIQVGSIGGLTAIVLTQADYNALAQKDPRGLYLIRAEG